MLHRERYLCLVWVAALGAAVAGGVTPVSGDTFYLEGGDRIEGEVLEDLGEAYRIRTLVGIADIEKQRIVRIEEGPSPWDHYREKQRQCRNTADGHYDLAVWCREHGLRPEAGEHLEKAIKLEPGHAAARRALGYVLRGGKWIRPPSPKAPSKAEREARRAARAEESLLRSLISEWFVKIKAIHRGRMSGRKAGMRSEKFRRAREQILVISDPLALPALTGVLSKGNTATRGVLIESLARFEEDEATMNLMVLTLLDPSSRIRRLAAVELSRRGDHRIVEHLRRALLSDEEPVLRAAAVALGVMKAPEAFEDLVAVLSAEGRQRVRMSRPIYLDSIRASWGYGHRYPRGRQLLYYRPGCIGVLGPGSMVGTDTWYEVRWVTTYRTEVQEALIKITGQNFGFDAAAWLKWWGQQVED